MFSVAVIGSGVISDSHFEGWDKTANANVVAIADIDEKAAKEKAERWNVERTETNYKKLLTDDSIDIIDICIPHYLHAETTIECLKAGKHVICEKPIALNLVDAQKVIEAEKAASGKLMIAENWYYIPSVAKGIEVAASGEIGEVFSIKANLDFPGLRTKVERGKGSRDSGWRGDFSKSGGGLLMDAGIHSLSVMRKIAGEVDAVIGLKGKSIHDEIEGMDDAFNVMLKFENGATGICHCSESSGWKAPKFDFEILGTNGAVLIDLIKQKVVTHLKEEVKEDEIPAKGGMTEELEHFVYCIENDKKPMSDSADQIQSLKLVLGAYKSAAESGKPIFMNDLKA